MYSFLALAFTATVPASLYLPVQDGKETRAQYERPERELDILPEPVREKGVPHTPAPKNNPGQWVSTADYPTAALYNNEEGATRFRLNVSPDGRAYGCVIVGSSGSSALDEATCRLVTRRAKFHPALDEEGNPTSGTFNSAVRWMIPGEAEFEQPESQQSLQPFRVMFSFHVGADGEVTNCEVEVSKDVPDELQDCPTSGEFKVFTDERGTPVAKNVKLTIEMQLEDAE